MAENGDLFAEDLPDSMEEYYQDFNFTPEELRTLCQILCEVRMSNVEENNDSLDETSSSLHIDYSLSDSETDTESTDECRSMQLLGDKPIVEENNESLEQTSSSLHMEYSLSDSEISTGENSSVSLESATSERLETLPPRVENVETPPPVKNIEKHPPSIENVDPDSDLDDFVHNVAPGIKIDSEQLASYSQFQSGVNMVSTQQP